MQVIKFVHVLRRIENIERDIEELHSLENNLPEEREYSEKVRIAVELEINNLLNEKIKLMELKIENPPEKIIDMVYPKEKSKEEKKKQNEKFPLEEMEKEYIFDFLYGSKKNEATGRSEKSSQSDEFLLAPSHSKKDGREDLLPEKSIHVQSQKNQDYSVKKTRDQIIKELPMID